jgi:peptide/nickel transport system ATP-binding protein
MTDALLRTEGLTKHFRVGGMTSRKTLHAVDEVSFEIGRGEIVALVGESGSGKSTIARLLARVYKPTKGEVYFGGRPLSSIRSRKDRLAYCSDVPMVFQDPYSSMNPAYRVTHGIRRAIRLHRGDLTRERRGQEAERVLAEVGLVPAGTMAGKFPHELSGGQRQRVGFAQALAFNPKLIVADEPVSMLDVSIRIGLLNLMTELRERQGVSFLYITHDVASARYIADRVLVMYAGRKAEEAPVADLFAEPQHPYTIGLLGAIPRPYEGDEARPRLREIPGRVPSLRELPTMCAFADRCPRADQLSRTQVPELQLVRPNHLVACFHPGPE